MKKRKDGRYCAKITIDGKPIYLYAYSVNELKEKRLQLMINHNTPKSTLFKDIVNDWFKLKTNLQYNTQKMYKLNLKYIESLYVFKIDKIKTSDILELLEPLKEKARTYNLVLLTLNQIFEYALDEGYIQKNPTRKIRSLKILKKEKKPLTNEQIKLIEYSLPLEPRLFICYFLLCTGLRREELIPLTYEDIDNVIHINKAVYFEHNQPRLKLTKNENARNVPVLESLKPYLNGTGLIFPNEKGNMMSATTYKRKIEFCSRYLNIPFSGHQLRHTYATLLYNSGVPIKEAQYFLGHKDIRILLNVYTHLDHNKLSIEKVENYLKSCQ